MDHVKNSSFRSTTWGCVSQDALQQTPVWKKYSDSKGRPTINENNLIRACLYSLGYDDKHQDSYYYRNENVVIRSAHNNRYAVESRLYYFPVRKNHKLEFFFMTNDLLHLFSEHNTEFINLSEFGLEEYQVPVNKKNKGMSRDKFIEQLAMKSMTHTDEQHYA